MTADGAGTRDWLEDAIDVHVHTAPDLVERAQDDLALARDALAAGMDGVVVKSHVLPTADRVAAVNRAVGEDVLAGGIALNGTVGGINPDAVETALELGAAIVWLPTLWAANHASRARAAGETHFVGQRVPSADEELVVARDGEVVPEMRAVIDLVAEYDAVVATGHVSPAEIEAVVDACVDAGATPMINHPFFRVTDLSIDRQADLADSGAVMEYCAYAIESTPGHTVERVAEAIERLGPDSCVLATDYGQADNPAVPGLASFGQAVYEGGVPESTVRTCLTETPSELLER
ncbi:DUF6282 family protein [Natrialbaceae archaeon AArc-T1-2]|uniref:DUF6282 family protein n=1 Tax=Natrialbaceae archaeon AArc-T1-2 TaxID=3053904 RepID=UPI00255AB921|nr:DUF6282 family protein [Natrialbaceae archaeon AArc-T1-2]WIV66396.1 DUF6282 family protein [Natrialbaceae archaeon AArc-T1-2]